MTPNKDALWNGPPRICAFKSWRALRLSCPRQFFLRAQLSYLSSENMSQPPWGRNDPHVQAPRAHVSLEGTFDHTVAGQILCVSASGWLVSLQQGGQRFASCILCILLDIILVYKRWVAGCLDSFLPSFSAAAVAFSVWTSGEAADKDQNVVVLVNLAKADFLGWFTVFCSWFFTFCFREVTRIWSCSLPELHYLPLLCTREFLPSSQKENQNIPMSCKPGQGWNEKPYTNST